MNQHQLIEIIGNKDVVGIIQDYMSGTRLKISNKNSKIKLRERFLKLKEAMNTYGVNIGEYYRKIFAFPGCQREPIYRIRFENLSNSVNPLQLIYYNDYDCSLTPTFWRQLRLLYDNNCIINTFHHISCLDLVITHKGLEYMTTDYEMVEDLTEDFYFVKNKNFIYE